MVTQSAPAPLGLIIDPDGDTVQSLSTLLTDKGFEVLHCSSIAESRAALKDKASTTAVAFVALDLPDGDGLELLGEESLLQDHTDVALMHHDDDPARAQRGIREQASYFFRKPLDTEFVSELLEDISQEYEQQRTKAGVDDSVAIDQFGMMRGNSPAMRKLYRVVRKVAPSNATVLVVGESGTGKELAAQTLHQMSGSSGPFVAMNCGAIASELAESELFGHEKGSFSGAERRHAGYFERAEGGTLLLDEVGEMPLDLQVKLLRVLETGKFRRVGGTQDLTMNVRFLAATNRDPETAIRDGLLREDLYFRIAQFCLRMPPLRERERDVAGLAHAFLHELNAEHDSAKRFSHDAIEAIVAYPWPGNVRELKSAVERAYILAEQTLEPEHLPEGQIEQAGEYLRISVGESLHQTEKQQILATIDACDGNKKEAAEALGIALKTLYNKLKEYDEDD